MKRTRASIIKSVVFWIIITTAYLSLSAVIACAAMGYRVNWQKRELQHTSLINLDGSERDVKITVNGVVKSDRLPLTVNYLLPGWYDVSIEKPGYKTWEKSYLVEEGRAYEAEDIVLWKNEITATEVTDQTLIDSLNRVSMPGDIDVYIGEMRHDDKIITRLSKDPDFYTWYPNKKFIFFQQDQEIRAIAIDGSNDKLIVKLENPGKTKIRFVENNRVMLYTDGNTVKRANIR